MDSHSKGPIGDTLSVFIQDVGVVQKLHTHNAPKMVGRSTPFFKRARKEGIDLTSIEPEQPDENYGEILVRMVKIGSARMMLSAMLWNTSVIYIQSLYLVCIRKKAGLDMR